MGKVRDTTMTTMVSNTGSAHTVESSTKPAHRFVDHSSGIVCGLFSICISDHVLNLLICKFTDRFYYHFPSVLAMGF